MFKVVGTIVAAPIAKLVNNSITEGKFPDILKQAKLVPIFKGGNLKAMSNYRPIAILPTLSKIFEKCIAYKLFNFLLKFNLISLKQSGLLKGRSTEYAFLDLIGYVYKSLNEKKHGISLFIDLKKAFDTVNNKIILGKLKLYSIQGTPLSWFENYFKDRKERVSIRGMYSTERVINTGVPQESILGPTLFIVYINDLTTISPLFTSILYADDTTLHSSHTKYDALILAINNELPKFYR